MRVSMIAYIFRQKTPPTNPSGREFHDRVLAFNLWNVPRIVDLSATESHE